MRKGHFKDTCFKLYGISYWFKEMMLKNGVVINNGVQVIAGENENSTNPITFTNVVFEYTSSIF